MSFIDFLSIAGNCASKLLRIAKQRAFLRKLLMVETTAMPAQQQEQEEHQLHRRVDVVDWIVDVLLARIVSSVVRRGLETLRRIIVECELRLPFEQIFGKQIVGSAEIAVLLIEIVDVVDVVDRFRKPSPLLVSIASKLLQACKNFLANVVSVLEDEPFLVLPFQEPTVSVLDILDDG